MIRINVTENTFKKTLTKLGFSYKIIQYEDMIKSIKRQTLKLIHNSIQDNNLNEVLTTIFGSFKNEMPITILINDADLKYISKDYLISLINDNKLSLFLEEEQKIYPKYIQENAYRYLKIKEIENKNIETYHILYRMYYKLLLENTSQHISLLKCINSDGIYLSKKEEEYLDKELKTTVYINYFQRLELNKVFLTFKLGLKEVGLDLDEKRLLMNFLIQNYFKKEICITDNIEKLELFNTKLSPKLRYDMEILKILSDFSELALIDVHFDYLFKNKNIDFFIEDVKKLAEKKLAKKRNINYSLKDDKIKLLINNKRFFFTFQEVLDFNEM